MKEIQLRDAKANLSAVVDEAMQGKPGGDHAPRKEIGRGRELPGMATVIPRPKFWPPFDGGAIGGQRSDEAESI